MKKAIALLTVLILVLVVFGLKEPDPLPIRETVPSSSPQGAQKLSWKIYFFTWEKNVMAIEFASYSCLESWSKVKTGAQSCLSLCPAALPLLKKKKEEEENKRKSNVKTWGQILK